MSGSSLSDSSYSVSSEVALGGPVRAGGSSCRPLSADHSATQWREASQSSAQCTEEALGEEDRRPVSTGWYWM